LSGREVVKVFERLGWEVARQRGSHIILVKKGHIATLSVPDHHEVAREICNEMRKKLQGIPGVSYTILYDFIH